MLEQSLPPNLRNHRGDGRLMLASYHGHAEAARRLLDFGADAALWNDQGQAPLAGAAYKGDAAMVSLLLKRGEDVESAMLGRRTDLMMAAMFTAET